MCKYITEYFVFGKTFYLDFDFQNYISKPYNNDFECDKLFVFVFYYYFCFMHNVIKNRSQVLIIIIIIKCMKSDRSTSRRNSFVSSMAYFEQKITFLFLVGGPVDTMVIIIICIYANLQRVRRHEQPNSYLALALITIIIVMTTMEGGLPFSFKMTLARYHHDCFPSKVIFRFPPTKKITKLFKIFVVTP